MRRAAPRSPGALCGGGPGGMSRSDRRGAEPLSCCESDPRPPPPRPHRGCARGAGSAHGALRDTGPRTGDPGDRRGRAPLCAAAAAGGVVAAVSRIRVPVSHRIKEPTRLEQRFQLIRCSLRPVPLVPSLVPWEQSPAPPGSILLSGTLLQGAVVAQVQDLALGLVEPDPIRKAHGPRGGTGHHCSGLGHPAKGPPVQAMGSRCLQESTGDSARALLKSLSPYPMSPCPCVSHIPIDRIPYPHVSMCPLSLYHISPYPMSLCVPYPYIHYPHVPTSHVPMCVPYPYIHYPHVPTSHVPMCVPYPYIHYPHVPTSHVPMCVPYPYIHYPHVPISHVPMCVPYPYIQYPTSLHPIFPCVSHVPISHIPIFHIPISLHPMFPSP
ncbi:uncharacterized protein LOC136023788 [Lathamus discolor]|uniref:uncharacterized protein LOC136023788 n=1 Tax=Lathamus discolor TaxID=678569 RepID=UPI0032B71EFB